VHEGALGVHEIEFMVETGENFSDTGGIGDHANGALHFGQVATGHNSGRLIVDPALESRGTPVHELDGALGLDGGD